MSENPEDDTQVAIVTTSVAGRTEAAALARALVTARLAACVQIMPIHSVYRWNDGIEAGDEHLLLCKIKAVDFEIVAEAIRARHDYEVPEIVMMPISAGSPAYLVWLADAVRR